MSPRADAARNAARLLAAARDVFAEQGAEAALDDIARRAGVGNATLYRHFPTRGDLLVAVYAEEVEALVAQGETLPLFEWLDAFVVHVATSGRWRWRSTTTSSAASSSAGGTRRSPRRRSRCSNGPSTPAKSVTTSTSVTCSR
jgi:AcrR family transcriptional regulator